MPNEEQLPDDKTFDWVQIRQFLRQEVAQEVRHAVSPLASKLESHDTRLSVVESSVKSIEDGVNKGRWETAEVRGMLAGFIGTPDSRGKFDISMDSIRATAERANVLSHKTRDALQTLIDWRHTHEGEVTGGERRKAKETTWVQWLVGLLASSGLGLWLLKHFKH